MISDFECNCGAKDPECICETPVAEGYVRIFEFMHGYRDIPEEELEAAKNDPLYKILMEEVTKEIDKEIIRQIEKNVRV